MNATQRPKEASFALLCCFVAVLHACHAEAVLPLDQPAITSLALVGTNLVSGQTMP